VQVVQKTSTLTNQLDQRTLRVKVFFVSFQVLSQMADAEREKGDLTL
jgi:hypothetical protein